VAWISYGLPLLGTVICSLLTYRVATLRSADAVNERVARLYYDPRSAEDKARSLASAVNIRTVEPDGAGGFRVYFAQPFPDATYAAVASATAGFAKITTNEPEYVGIEVWNTRGQQLLRDSSGNWKAGMDSAEIGQLSLLVFR
jgi:hypothetical protein